MPTNTISHSDLADIQGIVLNGYGHLTCSRFIFLSVTDVPAAKAWLGEILPEVTTAARRPKGTEKPPFAANIAFTYTGLQALQLPADALGIFPREFSEGMAAGERSRVLGDTDSSDPSRWDIGGPNKPPFDVLLMLYATKDEVLDQEQQRLTPGLAASKLTTIYSQDTGRISSHEPFGFHDGVSQPFIAGSPGEPIPGEIPINAGEFLLGYENGYGTIPLTPVVDAGDDPQNILAAAQASDSQEVLPGQKDFGRNGSYLVFRKLAQDVNGFWSWVEKHATGPDGQVDEYQKELLGAKIVGRWKDGSPLVLSPDNPDKALSESHVSNNFQYMPTDPDGMKCPVAAHIRRANPRDSQLPNPARSLVISNRHRILRRGRHYEDHHRADTWDTKGIEHGLCFIAINADIQRQFEFVQQTWVNSPKFSGLYDCKDPLVGDNDGSGHFAIPEEPVRRKLNNIPRFVQARGGGYFFLPGLRALQYLSKPYTPSPQRKPQPSETRKSPMTFFTDAWHDIVAGITHPKEELEALREALDKKGESLLANPGPLRILFGLLRSHSPIVTVGKLAIVSRYDDVLEVLTNNKAFSVTEIYLKKMEMTTGDFVLGLPDDARYEREIGIMRDVVKPGDVDKIDGLAKQWAEEQVAARSLSGKIDVVGDLSRIVPTRLVEEYFGTPGPDRATLQRWMRVIFREIFLNIENDPAMQAEAVKAGEELNAYLNALIAERKLQIAANPDAYDDFTSRLIKLQIADPSRVDDDTIRRIIGGTIVGTVDTNSKAVAQAIDQLLDRPMTLSGAHKAAIDSTPAFDAYIWEALQFNPQNPFLIRHCETDTVVAAGTPREKTIKAGSTVIVGTTSAMFDDLAFPEPNDFRTDRPFDKYIHFGHGQHTCFGRYFAARLIPQTAKALLKESGLRRADGDAGHIRYDGAFPDALILEFDGSSS